MNGQQSDKSSEEIFELIQEVRKMELRYRIKKLEDLLNEMVKNAQEKANLPEIKESLTVIDLDCNKHGNEPMQCGYNITTNIYNKDEVIECYSDALYLPSKIRCTKYSDKSSFELPDSIYFIQGIKKTIPDIYNILNPGVLTRMDKQYINIYSVVSMDLNKPIKENPEISKYRNEFIYNNGRSIIKMDWRFY